MHQLIRIIVYGKNKEEALEKAVGILDDFCEIHRFDYYSLFDEDFATKRWGKLPVIARADSKIGKKLIEDGLKFTKKELYYNLNEIRKVLKKKTNYQIWNTPYFSSDLFRFRCYLVGQTKGSAIFLYDNDGEGIGDPHHLKGVLNKWDSDKYKGLNVYVVPADIHY
ncbi:MAG: hypothetical protein ACTSR2_00830 [Candidatus Hodarchaeales archaeon]